MHLRDIVVRLVERCAACYSDPADRLQFLQRATASSAGGGKTRRFARTLGWILARHELPRKLAPAALAILAVMALVATVAIQASSKRSVALASAKSVNSPSPRLARPSVTGPVSPARIWMVESTAAFDLYSNGLRVENQFSTSTQPRKYLAFARLSQGPGPPTWRDTPSGIVFHTTESHIAPFEEDQNDALRRAGEGLLEYVSRRRAYHFVVDRFGRVFRVVRETDSANHAGHSIWADQNWIYVNLNESFFGVAFEARTPRENEATPLNSAQVHAARILTDMLRDRYGILPGNCIAHAQVSVNPGSWSAGYHTDWAAHLPFHELGLGDNYATPLASLALFGFSAGPALENDGSPVLRNALASAQKQIEHEALASGQSTERYRQTLQRRYQNITQELALASALQENKR